MDAAFKSTRTQPPISDSPSMLNLFRGNLGVTKVVSVCVCVCVIDCAKLSALGGSITGSVA